MNNLNTGYAPEKSTALKRLNAAVIDAGSSCGRRYDGDDRQREAKLKKQVARYVPVKLAAKVRNVAGT